MSGGGYRLRSKSYLGNRERRYEWYDCEIFEHLELMNERVATKGTRAGVGKVEENELFVAMQTMPNINIRAHDRRPSAGPRKMCTLFALNNVYHRRSNCLFPQFIDFMSDKRQNLDNSRPDPVRQRRSE